jgi:hypothetical protein
LDGAYCAGSIRCHNDDPLATSKESMMRVCKCVPLVFWLSLLPMVALAQPKSATYGAETPQAVVAGLQRAMKADNFIGAMPFISPAGRRELASEGISGLLLFFAFSDPDDQMPGSKPLPKAELAAKRKSYKTAVDTAKRTLKPHGLDKVIGKPPMAPETQQTIETALARVDTVALMTSLISMMDNLGPMLGMKKGDKPRVPFTLGNVTNYKIDGDSATARAAKETLEFERVDTRWYIKPPAPSNGKN